MNLCIWIFHHFKNASKCPSLTSERLLIKHAGQCVCSFYLSRWESCLIFVVPLANNDSSQQQRHCEDQSRKKEETLKLPQMQNQKSQRDTVKFINCFQAKAHNPICLQSSDSIVVWNDWLDAGVWAIHQCPFKMAVWLFANRAVVLQSECITSEDAMATASFFRGDH